MYINIYFMDVALIVTNILAHALSLKIGSSLIYLWLNISWFPSTNNSTYLWLQISPGFVDAGKEARMKMTINPAMNQFIYYKCTSKSL